MNNIGKGKAGEKLASNYLKNRGYRILEENYKVSFGEIDIIAQKGEFLVFVEVKTRTPSHYGTPACAVTYHKKQRMIKAAKVYMQRHGNAYGRFDVIEIFAVKNGENFVADKINHIINAFSEG